MYIGKKLRKLRLEKEITQSYLASKLGMSQTNYSNIENNITEISNTLIQEIAAVLKVSTESLVSGHETQSNLVPKKHGRSDIEINIILKEELNFMKDSNIQLTHLYRSLLEENIKITKLYFEISDRLNNLDPQFRNKQNS
jgi:transcriptional regulator with XRE-family HTH domain